MRLTCTGSIGTGFSGEEGDLMSISSLWKGRSAVQRRKWEQTRLGIVRCAGTGVGAFSGVSLLGRWI